MGGKVKANDRDIGDNAKSTYSIIEGDEQGTFEIVTDAQTQEGILRVKKVRPRSRRKKSQPQASCLCRSATGKTLQGPGVEGGGAARGVHSC